MPKLLLTSAGLINKNISQVFLGEFPEPINKIKTLIVAYAKTPEEEFYVNQSKQELLVLGLQDVVVANMYYQIEPENLGNFDVIYVCGGNTFGILNKLRETGLYAYILDQVNKGAMYVGVSAGSIIAGPDIEVAGWGSEGDKNEVDLKDLKGFNFVGIAIFPHFHEGLKDEVEEFKRKVDYKVMQLTDEQAIFVKGDNIKIME